MRDAGMMKRAVWISLLLLVTVVFLYDQVPHNAQKGDQVSKSQFLAERDFVKKIETSLLPNAMVYNYPYSQYLRKNKYYGWGSFSHIRLYLHSHQLHWSNGGAKNSPADDWNLRISQLPLDQLIVEIEAVGFAGFVIDRTVVKPIEYEKMRSVFREMAYYLFEDAASNYTFVRLKDPGFRLIYDSNYRDVDRLVIVDPERVVKNKLPEIIDEGELRNFIVSQNFKPNIVINKADHPGIFSDGEALYRRYGLIPITPLSDMHGKMSCSIERKTNTLILVLENQTQFDWKLGDGPLPIGIGVHVGLLDGKSLQFDNGFRLPTDAYIKRGARSVIRYPLDNISINLGIYSGEPLVLEFALVQDGNAWFSNISCKLPLA